VDHDIAIGAAVAISVFSLTIKSSSRRTRMKDPVVLITGALTGSVARFGHLDVAGNTAGTEGKPGIDY
jgi:hypothetical protein